MVNNKSSIINNDPPAHFESLYPPESRSAEIEKIIKFAKEGKSVQLIGLPGVGRSNLLGLLSFNKNVRKKHLGENQKWFHFIPVNFSEIKNRTHYEATKFIFLSLVESLRERKQHKTEGSSFAAEDSFDALNSIFKESSETNDEMVLFQGLKRATDFLCIEKELTIVFLFDRFEEYIPMLNAEFFSNLRALRNRAKYRFSVVFSIPRLLEDIIEPILFADFYEFLVDNVVYLPIADKPGLDFRISYLEKISGKHIENSLIEEITLLTGGHGKLTRIALESLIGNGDEARIGDEKRKTSSEPSLVALTKFLLSQKAIHGALYEIWTSLLPSEQKIIGSSEKRLALSSSENLYLENVGLIKDGKITIPLFEEFIQTLLRQDSGRAQQIIYNEEKNEILKGEIVLSEFLTSSEFKLLKFFIDNPDRIIEREEIIKAVWKDEKTTEGVTDQALDQLIFRLRKKIEDDPNNPEFIQTIKGRGLKFSNS